MLARRATSLSPEQLEDISSAFRTFDKEAKNALDLDELAGALGSLGVPEVVRRSLLSLAFGNLRRSS